MTVSNKHMFLNIVAISGWLLYVLVCGLFSVRSMLAV